MSTIKINQLRKWLLQAWPVWAIFLLIVLNVCLYRLFHYDRNLVHRFAGVALQIVGGAFVLFSLNKNMGVFKQGTLCQRVSQWWKSRPFFRKRIDAEVRIQGAGHLHVTGSPVQLPHRKLGTIEERVEELEKRIEEYRKEMTNGDDALRNEIISAKQELRAELSEKGRELAEVQSVLVTAVVSGVNSQLFGILLICYGTFLPIC